MLVRRCRCRATDVTGEIKRIELSRIDGRRNADLTTIGRVFVFSNWMKTRIEQQLITLARKILCASLRLVCSAILPSPAAFPISTVPIARIYLNNGQKKK
jgi:hypothetical protein